MSHEVKPPTTDPAIRVVMMPRDTNSEGTIFGGVILSLIDQAAYVEAIRQQPARYVTVSFREVEFHEPVFVGDLLSLYAEATQAGRTSLKIYVRVHAHRKKDPEQIVNVTEAEVVFVSVDAQGKPKPIFGD